MHDPKEDDEIGFEFTYLKCLPCFRGLAMAFSDTRRISTCLLYTSEKSKEVEFWTKEEYLKFSEAMKDKDVSYHAFEILYWCGLRLGELLALTPNDFDFNKKTMTISKSYQRIKGEDLITSPKTDKSNRIVLMPDFLVEEMKDYIARFYGCKDDSRLFPISKSYLHHEMDRGCKETGVKRIRIHGLRHPYAIVSYTHLDVYKRQTISYVCYLWL